MTVSLRACGHTGRPCRCAHLRRAARGAAEERADRYRRTLEAISREEFHGHSDCKYPWRCLADEALEEER